METTLFHASILMNFERSDTHAGGKSCLVATAGSDQHFSVAGMGLPARKMILKAVAGGVRT
jgi:hypothetical protein